MSKPFGSSAANGSPFDNIYRQRQFAFADSPPQSEDWLAAQRTAAFSQPAQQANYRSESGMSLPKVVVSTDGGSEDVTPHAGKRDVAEPVKATIKSSLSFNDFARNPAYDKFKLADSRMDQTYNADGTKQITYTAKDFSTCKMASKSDGTYGITLADRYGRPQSSEDIDTQGRSTLTAYAYQDANGKPSPWAASKSFQYADGTSKTHTYDKFGRMTSKAPITEVA
jgi:hypothetical protein